MLSIYGKKLRPQHEMEKIISATSGVEERTLKKWQKISTSDSDYIHGVDDPKHGFTLAELTAVMAGFDTHPQAGK